MRSTRAEIPGRSRPGTTRHDPARFQATLHPPIVSMFALAFMFAGIALGLLLRKTPIPALASRLLVPITCAMLFALGLAIGANPMIMDSLDSLGLQGLTFAVAGMVGSALVVSLFCRLFPDAGQLPVSHDGAPAKTPENPAAQGYGLEERSWGERP